MLNHIWVSLSEANWVFQNVWFVAALWMGLALVASLVSIWVGISVALIEILVGVLAGNFLHLHASNEWINFLALLGSGVLTFLAGAEIDPRSLKANLRASALIGMISFAAAFAIVWLFAQFVLGWELHQAQIAGIALSTTSVAVVYAVMIEGGFSDTAMGKMILAACFITDFGTVLALGGLFANYNVWLLIFVVATCIVLWFMPEVDKVDHRAAGRDAGERTGSEVYLFRSVFSGRSRHHRKERSGLAGLSRRARGRRSFSSRQDADSPNAQHRFCDVHAVLFHQSRALRFATGALAGVGGCGRSASAKNGDKNCRRLAAGAAALHAPTRGCLHHVAYGDGSDFRHDFGAVRIPK